MSEHAPEVLNDINKDAFIQRQIIEQIDNRPVPEHTPDAVETIDQNVITQQQIIEQFGEKTMLMGGKELTVLQAYALAGALCPASAADRALHGNAFVIKELAKSGHEIPENLAILLPEDNVQHPNNVDPVKKNEKEKSSNLGKARKVEVVDEIAEVKVNKPAAKDKVPEAHRALVEAPARKIVKAIPLERMLRSVAPVVEKPKPVAINVEKVRSEKPGKNVQLSEVVPIIEAPLAAILMERTAREFIQGKPVTSPSETVLKIVPTLAVESMQSEQTVETLELTEELVVTEDLLSPDALVVSEFMELPLETEDSLVSELPGIPSMVDLKNADTELEPVAALLPELTVEQMSVKGMTPMSEEGINPIEGVTTEQVSIDPTVSAEYATEVEKTPVQTVIEFVVKVSPAIAEQVYEFVTAEDTPPELVEIIEQKVEYIVKVADRLHELVMDNKGDGNEAVQIEVALLKEYEEVLKIMGIEPTEEMLKSFILYVRSEQYELSTKSDKDSLDLAEAGSPEIMVFDEVSVFAKAQKALQFARDIEQGIGKLLVGNVAA